MMGLTNRIIHFISLKKVIFSTLIFVILLIISNLKANYLMQTYNCKVLDFSVIYSPLLDYGNLAKMGISGRALYVKNILYLDFLFPMSYMFFGMFTIGFMLKMKKSILYYLMYSSLVAMFFDYLENITEIILCLNFPKNLSLMYELRYFFTISKFLFCGIAIVSIIVLFGCIILNRVRSYK